MKSASLHYDVITDDLTDDVTDYLTDDVTDYISKLYQCVFY